MTIVPTPAPTSRLTPELLDLIATDPTGQQWWIECKGSWRNVPGLERHDTLLKAIATAWALKHFGRPSPYLLVTTNLPNTPNGIALLDAAVADGLFDRVEVLT